MTSDHDPLRDLPRAKAPEALLDRVGSAGAQLLRAAPVRKKSPSERAVDVAIAGFCAVHLVWIARIVHLL